MARPAVPRLQCANRAAQPIADRSPPTTPAPRPVLKAAQRTHLGTRLLPSAPSGKWLAPACQADESGPEATVVSGSGGRASASGRHRVSRRVAGRREHHQAIAVLVGTERPRPHLRFRSRRSERRLGSIDITLASPRRDADRSASLPQEPDDSPRRHYHQGCRHPRAGIVAVKVLLTWRGEIPSHLDG